VENADVAILVLFECLDEQKFEQIC